MVKYTKEAQIKKKGIKWKTNKNPGSNEIKDSETPIGIIKQTSCMNKIASAKGISAAALTF